MRTARTILLLCTGLAGCGFLADSTPKLATPRPLASKECAAVAQERMQDAAANGYETEIQKAIFSGSYASCANWDAAHGMPPNPSR